MNDLSKNSPSVVWKPRILKKKVKNKQRFNLLKYLEILNNNLFDQIFHTKRETFATRLEKTGET